MRRSHAFSVAGAAGVALAVTTSFGVLPVAASSTAAPISFTTQGTTTWTVPAGVTQVRVVAAGAKGADTPAQSFFHSAGGPGSRVTATLDVTPGATLQVGVGIGGGASAFGGAGGGAADVRTAPYGLFDRVVVAAGGGGAGADSSQCGTPGAGGTGGGGAGGPGPAQHGECAPGGTGGAGATATTAGTGGDAFYVTVHHSGDGSFGSGGTAIGSILDDAVGGGGGGGWFGGGAGGGLYQAFAGSGGGGGGGSDYVTPAARDVAVADGVTTGAASVTITPIAGATVSFTSVYNRGEAFRLHQYASRTNRSDAQTQHDATVSLATLLDRLLSGNDGRRHGRDGLRTKQHDTSARRGGVSVTSVYSTADAALVSKVARVLGLSEPAFQKFAVMMLSRSPDHG